MTDQARWYPAAIFETGMVLEHGVVNHSAGQYVRDKLWHTNTVENYFSILKRGIVGTFHSVSQQHLARYIAEFDFRYNNREGRGINDMERFEISIPGIVGRRLMCKQMGEIKN